MEPDRPKPSIDLSSIDIATGTVIQSNKVVYSVCTQFSAMVMFCLRISNSKSATLELNKADRVQNTTAEYLIRYSTFCGELVVAD